MVFKTFKIQMNLESLFSLFETNVTAEGTICKIQL